MFQTDSVALQIHPEQPPHQILFHFGYELCLEAVRQTARFGQHIGFTSAGQNDHVVPVSPGSITHRADSPQNFSEPYDQFFHFFSC